MKIDGKQYLQMMEEVMDIASYYLLAKRTLLAQEGMSLSSGDMDAFNPYYQFIDKVNKSFLKLENIHKEVLINEFFSPEDKYWWQLYYKQSTFISLKAKAMKSFLKAYHEFN
jgi:hypothetical protein